MLAGGAGQLLASTLVAVIQAAAIGAAHGPGRLRMGRAR